MLTAGGCCWMLMTLGCCWMLRVAACRCGHCWIQKLDMFSCCLECLGLYIIVIPWLRGLYRFYCPSLRVRVIKPVQPDQDINQAGHQPETITSDLGYRPSCFLLGTHSASFIVVLSHLKCICGGLDLFIQRKQISNTTAFLLGDTCRKICYTDVLKMGSA